MSFFIKPELLETNDHTCFLTGSHVYGIPTTESDIDLAILVSEETFNFLFDNRDKQPSIRFGSLNLVMFTDLSKFNRWKKVTNELEKQKPVTRDFAISKFVEAGFDEDDYGLMRDITPSIDKHREEVE